ncbi:MAG: hypothetical protein ACREGB_05425 [Candidatus Saccharimonadales bacterium]
MLLTKLQISIGIASLTMAASLFPAMESHAITPSITIVPHTFYIYETVNLGPQAGTNVSGCIPATGEELPESNVCYLMSLVGLAPNSGFAIVQKYNTWYDNAYYDFTVTFVGTYNPGEAGIPRGAGVNYAPTLTCTESDACNGIYNGGTPTGELAIWMQDNAESEIIGGEGNLYHGDFLVEAVYSTTDDEWAVYLYADSPGVWDYLEGGVGPASDMVNALNNMTQLKALINQVLHDAETSGFIQIPPGGVPPNTGFSFYLDLIDTFGYPNCLEDVELGAINVTGNC